MKKIIITLTIIISITIAFAFANVKTESNDTHFFDKEHSSYIAKEENGVIYMV